MAQLPIDQTHKAGTPIAREEIWARFRARLGEWMSLDALQGGDAINLRTASSFLDTLVAAGHAERRRTDGARAEYRLTRDLGVHVPRYNRAGKKVTLGSGVENMWRSMRISKQFDARELAMLSTTDDVTVELATAKKYCSMLFRAGYLRVTRKGSADGHLTRYRLIRDTGPKAPKIQNVKRVWDPNTRELMSEVQR